MSRRSERIAHRISITYNTNLDLVFELVELVGQNQTIEILEMRPKDLRLTARINSLLGSREEIIELLLKDNIVAEPIQDLPEGIEIVKGGKKLGSSLTYLKGYVMPQGLGSMLTVDVLDPQQDEFILDMAAAPGGKSCFIAERMKNTGHLIANDISTVRLRSLQFNLSRQQIKNTTVMNQDGKRITGYVFDKILLDAPCTGGGLLVSQLDRRQSKSSLDSIQLQSLQLQLLSRALTLLKEEGICVYSTCAISPIENEMIVDRFKSVVDFQPLDIAGNNSFLDDNIIGKRLFPHLHQCDGFFITKMVKL